jgi:hypothetical protein
MTIGAAAKAAGVSRRAVYRRIKHTPRFDEAVRAAQEIAGDYARAEVWRRAIEGVAEPVIYQGTFAMIGYTAEGHECPAMHPNAVRWDRIEIKKYSDPLLAMLVRARCSEFNNDRSTVNLNVGGPSAEQQLTPEQEKERIEAHERAIQDWQGKWEAVARSAGVLGARQQPE